MITDKIVSKSFISNVMSAGVRKIYTLQNEIAQANLNRVSGKLFDSLVNMPFYMDGTILHVRILPYLRYLDIHARQNRSLRSDLALYNRTVWGVLYGETLPALRYGLTQDVKNYISEQLRDGKDIDSQILNSLIDY